MGPPTTIEEAMASMSPQRRAQCEELGRNIAAKVEEIFEEASSDADPGAVQNLIDDLDSWLPRLGISQQLSPTDREELLGMGEWANPVECTKCVLVATAVVLGIVVSTVVITVVLAPEIAVAIVAALDAMSMATAVATAIVGLVAISAPAAACSALGEC